ncbi:MAG: hypothetical protein ABH885_07955, partial [Candidatus Omnitrophota bacterium]
HTDNLSELFKENGISYVSIIPNFRNDDRCESRYFEILSGGISDFGRSVLAALSTMQVTSLCNALSREVEEALGQVNGIDRTEMFRLTGIALESIYEVTKNTAYKSVGFKLKNGPFIIFGIDNGMPVCYTSEEAGDAYILSGEIEKNIDDMEYALHEVSEDILIKDGSRHVAIGPDIVNEVVSELEGKGLYDLAGQVRALADNSYEKPADAEKIERSTALSAVKGLKASHAGGQGLYVSVFDGQGHSLLDENNAPLDQAAWRAHCQREITHELLAGNFGAMGHEWVEARTNELLSGDTAAIAAALSGISEAERYESPLWQMDKETRSQVKRDYAANRKGGRAKNKKSKKDKKSDRPPDRKGFLKDAAGRESGKASIMVWVVSGLVGVILAAIIFWINMRKMPGTSEQIMRGQPAQKIIGTMADTEQDKLTGDNAKLAGKNIYIYGIKHTDPVLMLELERAINYGYTIPARPDTKQSAQFREQLKSIFSQPSIQQALGLYREYLKNLRSILSDPANNITILGVEATPGNINAMWQALRLSGMEKEKRMLIERGIPPKVADDIFLLFHGVIRYMTLGGEGEEVQAMMKKLIIVPMENEQYMRETVAIYARIDRLSGQISTAGNKYNVDPLIMQSLGALVGEAEASATVPAAEIIDQLLIPLEGNEGYAEIRALISSVFRNIREIVDLMKKRDQHAISLLASVTAKNEGNVFTFIGRHHESRHTALLEEEGARAFSRTPASVNRMWETEQRINRMNLPPSYRDRKTPQRRLKDIGDEDIEDVPPDTLADWIAAGQAIKPALSQIIAKGVPEGLRVRLYGAPASEMPRMAAYNEEMDDGTILIVLRKGLSDEIRQEALYHELWEAYFIRQLTAERRLSAEDVRRTAHRLAAAKEVLVFGRRGITPYHRQQLNQMAAAGEMGRLSRIVEEYDAGRGEQYRVLEEFAGRGIFTEWDIGTIKLYERKLSDEARSLTGQKMPVTLASPVDVSVIIGSKFIGAGLKKNIDISGLLISGVPLKKVIEILQAHGLV